MIIRTYPDNHSLMRALISRQPGGLLDENSLSSAGRILSCLPPLCSLAYGFETRLGEPGSRADFALCLTGKSSCLLEVLPSPGRSLPFMHTLLAFFREWQTKDSILYSTVKNLWLEFDLSPGNPQSFTPGYFLGFRSQSGFMTFTGSGGLKQLEVLLKYAFPAEIRRMISLYLEPLPLFGGYVGQLGIMGHRKQGQVRLCICGLSTGDLIHYLAGIYNPEIALDLQKQLEPYRGLYDYPILHLDLVNSKPRKLGLEFRIKGNDLEMHNQVNWHPLLKFLASCNNLYKHKCQLLFNWPQRIYYPQVYRNSTYRWHDRILYYLKAIYSPGQELDFKAYFGILH